MTLDDIKNQIPDYAKDLRINFKNVFSSMHSKDLNEQQIYMTALSTAIASRNLSLTQAIEQLAIDVLDETQVNAAKTAAALMGMNNIYYRFAHLSSNSKYLSMPANLRMQGIKSHGIEEKDFELISLAVSAVNGCGLCIDSHEKVLIKHGVSELTIQSAVRIASVMHAVAVTLEQAELSSSLKQAA